MTDVHLMGELIELLTKKGLLASATTLKVGYCEVTLGKPAAEYKPTGEPVDVAADKQEKESSARKWLGLPNDFMQQLKGR